MHSSFVAKTVHLKPGISSRRRPRASDNSNSDDGITKRQKSNPNIQSNTKDFCMQAASLQPLSHMTCNLEFGDQLVPSQSFGVFSVANEGFQLNFFDDTCNCLSSDNDTKVEVNKEHPLGYFSLLPTELFHYMLALLENSDLSTLASLSAEMCTVVCGYVYTPIGLNHVLPQYSEGDFVEPMKFTEIGLLVIKLCIFFLDNIMVMCTCLSSIWSYIYLCNV